MNKQRLQKIDELFQSALDLAPERRADFLDAQCDGDLELRAEVESLLSAHREAGDFIEDSASDVAAELLQNNPRRSPTQVGQYKIEKLLAVGGMGEVYQATDRLGRRVALKLLASRLYTEPQHVARFLQEAQTLLALNHPNIVTLYDIGEADGIHYIASELIEGENLRQHFESTDLTLTAVLEIVIQVATALAAAHEKGIVHRDIKPENVMIRRDGFVKVLDFGIAKLTESFAQPVSTEAPTRPKVDTAEGLVIGTATYMSPEQVRGVAVDARTDIWSCGATLYEMLTAKVPFAGSTAAEVVAQILDREPAPLARSMTDPPPELQRIINKALMKNREERYQTIKDLLLDLKALKQDLEFTAKLKRSGSFSEVTATEQLPKTKTTSGENVNTNASWGKFVDSRRAGLLIIAILATVGVAAFVLMWRSRQTRATSEPEIRSLAVLPLKSLDAGENYLGLGIADAVIRRVSQTGQLIVRPTSAVRHYLNEDTDALTAARQLSADAVLDGNVQHAGQRLRVSVNLLRVRDSASLWTNNFDMQMTDIFTIQDTVAQQVASHLQLQLDPSQQAQLMKRYTSNPVAYEFYLKGVYRLDQRMFQGSAEHEATIDFFKKAIEADPNFALACAQLAYTYALVAVFDEPTEPTWAAHAREEINRAQMLDPQLAETHLASSQMLFSEYEGYQGEAAIRELLSAQQLNPNIGHGELGYLYIHLGLEDLAQRELEHALEIDPTSEFAKGQTLNLYEQGARYDEWFAAHEKFFPNEHGTPFEAWYFMGKGRLEEAQKAIDEAQKAIAERGAKNDDIALHPKRALLFALKGDFRAAEAEIPVILSQHPAKDPFYHHATYDIACIYALEGKSDEAVKWLRETAASGFQPYPLFERDAYLNRIRQAPAFIQFMAEMKVQNERYRREFGGAVQ